MLYIIYNKKDVPDTQGSPAVGIVGDLKGFEVEVYGHDPLLGRKEIVGFWYRTHSWQKETCVIISI